MNGDSKSTNERGHSLVGSLACPDGTRVFGSALADLVVPAQNIFFRTVQNTFVLIAQQAGQAVVLGLLSLSGYLCSERSL
jgi:hypothetical protein